MKKKLCAVLLALCLPLTLLTGCGSKSAADGFLDTLLWCDRRDHRCDRRDREDPGMGCFCRKVSRKFKME